MDLIVGATGMVGGRAARRLAESGRQVRALVRDPDRRPEAEALASAGIEVASGDLTRPETLAAACRGVDVVVCTATSMPDPGEEGLRRVDRDGVQALITAAEEAGVRTFVYVSFSGNIELDFPLRNAKRAAERRLLESSLRAVVLRPSYFAEVWLGPHLGFDPLGGRARIYGSGDAGISYIRGRDVADFSVAVSLREARDDLVLELGGPEPVSQLEAVRIFEEALGRELELERVPIEALEAKHASEHPLESTFGGLMLAYARGDVVAGASETAARYGVRLGSVGEWAREVAGG